MYDDLIERILYAQEEMLKHCVEANTVVINGKKYGKLAAEIQWAMFHSHTPTLVGLAAEAANLPDDWDFIVQNRVYPPMSKLDRLTEENKRLKQKLENIRAMMEEE